MAIEKQPDETGSTVILHRQSRMKMRTTGMLAMLALVAGALFPIKPVHAATLSIDPRRTFLRTNNDATSPSIPIALASLGVSGGDLIRLEQLGDFQHGVAFTDTGTTMIGVFSTSNILLGSSTLHRVQDAIAAGAVFVTSSTFVGGLATDIPQDFRIINIVMQIPVGATHLFVAASDSFYSDNTDPDGDYAIRITRIPSPVLETLTHYDNFTSALLNPTKWTGSAFDTLETLKSIVFPVAGDGELRLEARAYGLRTSSLAGEGRNGNNRLRFRRPDPNVIRATKATIRVNSASAVGCPTAGSEITQARLRLVGYLFNAGNGELGRAADDVQGRIEIRRLSNNPVANELNVRAVVIRCTDTECDRAETLFNETLGTLLVGQAATVLMQWNPPSNLILFQLNAKPVVALPYALSDTTPPMNFFDKKHIEINHFIGSCVAAQTSAFMSANVDDVFLNSAATLAPFLTAAEALAVDAAGGAPAESEPFVPEPEDEPQKPAH